ncbi:saccharopine dehydrogenase NADP-binding domain-containing protein, partial [bacterium]|nr:saccharopine dehydrogenase NADP-binding domain-containing protein [candidate division CSSED10-310 bacterium]
MKIVLVGAGRIGLAIAYDLVRSEDVTKVIITDTDANQLGMTRTLLASPKVEEVVADASQTEILGNLMADADGVVSAVPYRFNLELTRLALEHGCHFCDLGGNNTVVARQFELHQKAREAKVRVIPDCGLAPGMVSVLVAAGISRLDRTDEAHIRVGGLPLYPEPPLNYFLLFSATGLINEYTEPVLALRDGRITELEPMSELEDIVFPEPFGSLEAFTTSGGASTLPHTYKHRIRDLDYKTIRYPGHCEMIRLLMKLGLTSDEPETVADLAVRP